MEYEPSLHIPIEPLGAPEGAAANAAIAPRAPTNRMDQADFFIRSSSVPKSRAGLAAGEKVDDRQQNDRAKE
jgi:hypothetical protein